MSICAECNASAARKPTVNCDGFCKRLFHSSCVGVPSEVQKLLPTCPGLSWKCDKCYNDVNDSFYTNLKSKIETLFEDLNSLFNNAKIDFKQMAEEKLKSLQPTSSPLVQTYTEKLSKKSSIIIKPNDESQLNSATKMDIMKKINPLVNNINSVKNIKNGGLIVGCNDVNEANKFKEIADKELKNYKIKDANKIQPRVRIVGLSEKLNEEEIKQYLFLQNLRPSFS
ncbi:unnamed protein product [Brassicogethes aeneus]|uniref:PHD-type domain-containing protein n=1 Tax=Brassicogethes aeneus TaxID=1431903 RepID=A0A9P0FD24_BRAAE|nr:unnamed protein product [Brassicogethes aeneus]